MTAAELIVKALADNNPLVNCGGAETTKFCSLCGALQGGAGVHKYDCPWRLAVEATYPQLIPALRDVLYPDGLQEARAS